MPFRAVLLIALSLLPFCSNGQIITTIAGTGAAGYSGDGGLAVSAQLSHPDKVVLDIAGNVYVADEHNHVIRKITTAGIITTVVGTGIAGYSGDGGPATSAQISRPGDMIFDQLGNLYLSDGGNNRIRRVSPAGTITTFAGSGSNGYSGDGGLATLAKISDPLGLAFDMSGNFYFSDNANKCIRKINPSGIISTVVGTGIYGFSGDGGPATSARVSLTGYLAISSTNEMYFGDYGNHRVRKVNSLGIISTLGGNGSSSNSGDGGLLIDATFFSPFGVLFDQLGNLYISDRVIGVVRKVDLGGIITTIAGTGTTGYGGDGRSPLSAQFGVDVLASALDAAGNLYIADPNNHRIRKITYHPEAVTNLNSTLPITDIFPNPATNNITISANTTITSIELLNTLGQVVCTATPSIYSQQVTFTISHLSTGIYLVRVNGVNSGKVIKQ